MVKTYTEKRQQAYFRAAVELYKLVVEIADENIDCDPALTSDDNRQWAGALVESTFAKAYDLEQKGHEEWSTSSRNESWLARSREKARDRTAEGRALKARVLEKLGQA